MEILPGRRPAVSLVPDSSAALAWIHAEETTDAAYLELAHRRSVPLATLDEELREAGRALNLPLLGASHDGE